MRKLSSVILLVILCGSLSAQSPHGKDFSLNCSDCHTTEGWKVNLKNLTFNHDQTKFHLTGQHKQVNCISCHKTLVFSQTGTDCISCHTDMHYQTVGLDCGRCHTPKSWIVENITAMHQASRFPLVGPHVTADCYACHPSESLLRFEPLGVECFDCHKNKYYATTAPNHVESNYSTTCEECHLMTSFDWTGANINHTFFPLTGGHAIDCIRCHTTGAFAKIPAECVSCHQTDYNSTNDPNHATLGFPTNCAECHTLNPGWKPAGYTDHDAQFFPIYSGSHNGVWNSCTDCHTNPGDYSTFTCIDCHEHSQANTDGKHNDVGGYSYNSIACFECHPRGSAEGGFNHNLSNFPLTGAHQTLECNSCHANGFAGTPTICFACHQNDFNQTNNPNHTTAGFATDCETCHTTALGWKPATFDHDGQYFPIYSGKHQGKWDVCSDCHTNSGNYAIYTCTSNCHLQTQTNQNHNGVGGYTYNDGACFECHPTGSAEGAFNHATSIFPLTGAHLTTECAACHINGFSGTPTICFACHETNFNQSANPNHSAIGIPTDCESCHTTAPGWQPATFPIHNNYYALQGAHTSVSCFLCHEGNYVTTPNLCYGCHSANYNQTTNPNHTAAQFPTTCETCHSETAWTPATFDHDGLYFPIYSGSHAGTWSTCSQCHPNPSNFSAFTCLTCHTQGQTDPEHNEVSGYSYNSDACYACHPTGHGGGKLLRRQFKSN